MGRPATSRRTTHCGAGGVDRSAGGGFGPDHGPSGTAPLGPARTGPVLSRPAPHEAPKESEVGGELTLQQLWFQLPVPERQRFGHCFSAMLLKALGLRPAGTQEVKA